jgi:hypothetical protein
VSLGKKSQVAVLLSSCAVAGGVVLAVSTPWGLGISPDSAVYVGAVRSLLQGQGFSLPTDAGAFAPIVHYPPLYPALLAVPGFVGIGPIAAARWLNVLLFSVNIFLVGVIAFNFTASVRFGVVTSALVVTAFPMVLVHSMAWSEPLFVFLELCGILFLLGYFREPSLRRLSAAALFIGLSTLIRYAGVAFLISGAAGVLALGASRRKRRVFDAVAFVGIGSLPIALWVIRNRWIAGIATNRQIGFHPAGFDRLGDVLSTLVSWFSGFGSASIRVQILTVCLVLVAGSLFLIGTWFLTPRDGEVEVCRAMDVLQFMALIIGTYLLVLYTSISALDVQIPIDSRILSPLYVPFVLLAVSVVHRLDWLGRGHFLLPALALLVIGLQLPSGLDWLRQLRRDGIGYSSRLWMESKLIRHLSLIDPSVAIFSNAPDVVYTLTGRPSAMIPRKVHPDNNLPNPDYDAQIEAMMNMLKTKNGLLVYFNGVRWRWYLPSANELEEVRGLKILIRTNDGSVYQVN